VKIFLGDDRSVEQQSMVEARPRVEYTPRAGRQVCQQPGILDRPLIESDAVPGRKRRPGGKPCEQVRIVHDRLKDPLAKVLVGLCPGQGWQACVRLRHRSLPWVEEHSC